MNAQALLVDQLTRGSAVLAVAFAAAWLLRRQSAALRHAVLAAAILCAAATPFLSRFGPSWHVGLRPEPAAVLTTVADDPGAPVAVPRAEPARVRLESIVAPVWTAGASVGLLLLAAGFLHLRRLCARATVVTSGVWGQAAADIARSYGLRRTVPLLQTDHPSLLVTWGIWHPTVILPAGAPSWTPERARIVLAHEFAHIERGDWAVHMAAMLVRAAFWFNPLMWVACRRLVDESEQACDDRVLATGVGGPVYAAHLVELARAFKNYRRGRSLATPAPAIVKTSSLERRVRAMLQLGLNRNPISRTASIATLLALAAITVPLAGFGAAQTGPATLTGTLVDAVGRILPDVPVTLTNAATAATTTVQTDASGGFTFSNVPSGDYELTASLPGFGGRYRLTLTPGANVNREVPLQLGVVQESVTVRRGAAPRSVRAPFPMPDYNPGSDPCRLSQRGGCLEPPTKLYDVRPEYPPSGGEADTVVKLHAIIGTDGFVKEITPVSSTSDRADAARPMVSDPFVQSAAAAVSQWRFKPTRLEGVALETQMNVSVRFTPQP